MSPHQLYVHLAWTTRDRRPMIDRPTRDFLEQYFRRTAARERADVVTLAILRTHVHMLLRTVPRIDLPRLVQYFKGGSSYAASRLPGNVLGLRWAPEYSATTVGPKQLADVIRYIEEQGKRHPGGAVEDSVRDAGRI
ncbi:MAG: IS200/IS605 family transposase [Gemmatimonadetes bacterium]|nr:MAG: IS200/IS605 family transposase [Gemmatimonadota bacterium]